ncbi:MAG TPA: CoA-binding protein [Paludibacter sp.]|nr:CoA-binding protein [Paludibacter sp.]
MEKTLIIGASSNPERYSYKAAQRLLAHGYEIEMIGKKPEVIFDRAIDTEKKDFEDIDTVTLYISDKFQPEYYEYIISLNPRRVIFNPGTENPEFEELLIQNDIHVEEACTLVLLETGQY